MDTLIKTLIIFAIILIWCVISYSAWNTARTVWATRNLDIQGTLRVAARALVDGVSKPFSYLIDTVQESHELEVSLTPTRGYTFTPRGGETITGQSLEDRQQYRLAIHNTSRRGLSDIKLRLQLPYPIEEATVQSAEGASDLAFAATGVDVTVELHGADSRIEVLRKPLSPNWELSIQKLQRTGQVTILLLLNSWRDPRGKTIPKEEAARYFVPESGPSVTYVYGTYKVDVGGSTLDRTFYAPFVLHDDKTVSLGPSGAPPDQLKFRSGLE